MLLANSVKPFVFNASNVSDHTHSNHLFMEIAVLVLMLAALHFMGLPAQNKPPLQDSNNQRTKSSDERHK
ncbi:hypothetical protein B6N25_08555 [Sphingobacteriales bacterium TSM_CSS]|nr:hypothetical protein B6N25_08555 [Sphingobacteriales bacterium TSM_CSS]